MISVIINYNVANQLWCKKNNLNQLTHQRLRKNDPLVLDLAPAEIFCKQ